MKLSHPTLSCFCPGTLLLLSNIVCPSLAAPAPYASDAGVSDGLNFQFSASATPKPFKVAVDEKFIELTELKAKLFRPSRDVRGVPNFEDGPDQRNMTAIRDHWVNNYNWQDVQADMNKRFRHFTTTTHAAAGSNYTEPIPLHFIHHKTHRPKAIPILFLHGWPSSFLEWSKLVEPLTNPPNKSLPAFDVVAVDLPGFGFSPAPEVSGLGSRVAGQAFNDLMHQLGYPKYAIYTTDLGQPVGRWMVHDAANSVISHVSDFYVVNPSPDDLARRAAGQTTEEENLVIDELNEFEQYGSAYYQAHATRPLQLAIGMNDSPVGFVGWIWQLIHLVADGYPYTAEELITEGMMLFIGGVYGNVRAYKEWTRNAGGNALNDTAYPSSNVPTAILQFPEVNRYSGNPWAHAPRSWFERTANVTYINNKHAGGHFPAVSNPNAVLHDLWEFYGDPSISGVDRLG
ncbi:MAG: hypothetical protein M1831_005352 [Alyxoria varia]|nr:MAG: hypothetical protein M1831_005352 [Alyxoria varia]